MELRSLFHLAASKPKAETVNNLVPAAITGVKSFHTAGDRRLGQGGQSEKWSDVGLDAKQGRAINVVRLAMPTTAVPPQLYLEVAYNGLTSSIGHFDETLGNEGTVTTENFWIRRRTVTTSASNRPNSRV